MRAAIPLVVVLVIVGGIALVKARQIGALVEMGRKAEAAGPPPEVIATSNAAEQTWEATLAAVGSVESQKGVSLSAEVAGVVRAIKFESGAIVKKGDVLVELEADVERAQLASALARKTLAASSLARNQALVDRGVLPKAQIEGDEAALKTADADSAAVQAQIARKTLRAPFGGKLGIRAVNLGQYVTPGTMVTVLETTEAQYVDFTLPQGHLAEVAIGMPVRIRPKSDAQGVEGSITAIDPTVDPITRSLRLRATANNDTPAGKALRPGMFVELAVVLPKKHAVIAVPVTAVVHASYGDSVFVVEPAPNGKPGKVARQQFVRTAETRGDFVAIADGLKGAEEVVVAGAFKLRNGAPVTVNNEVKPSPSTAPTPENR